MYCTNCGKEINVNDKFCKNCGNNIENEEQHNKIVNNSTEEKNTKYYHFFSKYYLMIIAIINVIGLANYQNVEVWDIYVCLGLILEIVIYIVAPLILLCDMQKPTRFTWILLMAFFALDYIYRVISASLITYLKYMDTNIITYIIISIGLYGVWFIPNIVYFVKRREMFKNY